MKYLNQVKLLLLFSPTAARSEWVLLTKLERRRSHFFSFAKPIYIKV